MSAARALGGTPGAGSGARAGAQVWSLRGHCRLGLAGTSGFSLAGGRQTLAPGVSPASYLPTPAGAAPETGLCPTRRGAAAARALSRGARTTCFAANRGRRLIQSELLKGAATPPPFP